MSDAPPEEEEATPKKSKLPVIIGLVLALAGGGGGFYATFSGMILGTDSHNQEEDATMPTEVVGPDVEYVAVDQLVISMRAPSNAKHLVFRAHLEVTPAAKEAVEKLLPRVVDVLNSYLRALEPADLEDPASLTRLRAQMLRRVQVVTGIGKVNDLLIMEFVLN
ncbi:flagellar basal body protein FliL [Sulfitobacter sp. M57]|uniref:flagellar basal body-associated FliL family protein n=1 Tax=unclassified Sulfitobacter TaxID=196795 RepID=UPI0023E2D7B3|nr:MULTISPECIES: flagellar basal body-associated FliL family protein [unclassified Sulfitobacter]MDF3415214.1 flagellar basal body protein FliL [Sulfitobacter sp. KE5]MDF3422695.1 flagellar basal body protein FliL [Sulfitobacter sp. KE43]MDF3433760.1 flagellar basal body protein FliL [Sulfitobacter sp. KE42]MDF3459400.1 flagellar basal body protein FliL [Sulfitobacter sp. S74]MDF3463299.1 flagellar basal body protein FliL [Sulfitobacter sp. Ks18]